MVNQEAHVNHERDIGPSKAQRKDRRCSNEIGKDDCEAYEQGMLEKLPINYPRNEPSSQSVTLNARENNHNVEWDHALNAVAD